MKLGRAPTTLMIFSILLGGSQVRSSSSQSHFLSGQEGDPVPAESDNPDICNSTRSFNKLLVAIGPRRQTRRGLGPLPDLRGNVKTSEELPSTLSGNGSHQKTSADKLINLQPDNPRVTLFPQLTVQRISRVYNQAGKCADSFVVDLAVVGDDDDAIAIF